MRALPALLTTSEKPSLRQTLAIRVASKLWRSRATTWDEAGSARLSGVVDAVLASCAPAAGRVAVDLGCGSGQVSLPLARAGASVLAVDVSSAALRLLEEHAQAEGAQHVQALEHPIETLDLRPASVDLVVSNYALHHLRDADKRAVIERAFGWLRPGGRLVVGDMMFGRGGDKRDRAIIRSKLGALALRGPGGWWRILKNAWRFSVRFQEKPLNIGAWQKIAEQAGFAEVTIRPVVAEACVLSARKQPASPPYRSRPHVAGRFPRARSRPPAKVTA